MLILLLQQENCNPSNTSPTDMHYEVVSIESQAELDRRKNNMSLTLSPNKMPPTQAVHTPGDPDDDSGKHTRFVYICLFKMFLRWILGIFNVQIQRERGHKFM